jgi:hypothetical protein
MDELSKKISDMFQNCGENAVAVVRTQIMPEYQGSTSPFVIHKAFGTGPNMTIGWID